MRQAGESMDGLDLLKKTRIATEDSQPRARDLMALARTNQLTAYDAVYLELARGKGLPLATLDRRLADAAAKAGVKRA